MITIFVKDLSERKRQDLAEMLKKRYLFTSYLAELFESLYIGAVYNILMHLLAYLYTKLACIL